MRMWLKHYSNELREREREKKGESLKKVEAVAHEINWPNYNKVWLLVSVRAEQFIFITIC